ncbi:LRR domain containing protein [Trema orientale]|uniref:LRR domain containing protein n=1 Tax=Trema orientale TaxID=63057 RepID=A0A2P5ECU8_TREOI|nr:LRR domain containing protein [Trema orientale]
MHDLIRGLCTIRARGEIFMQVIYPQNRDEVVNSLSSTTLEHVGLTMLRVLKIEGQAAVNLSLPREIGDFIHLRLLSVRNSSINGMSFSLSSLRCLQLLDLRMKLLVGSTDFEIPNMTGKSGQQRHLYNFCLHPHDAQGPNKLHPNSLKSLRTLVNIPMTFIDLNHWAQLTNLTKLGMFVDSGQNLEDIFEHDDTMFNHLQSLTLKLRRTSFEDDLMSTLEKLSNLRILRLDKNAFEGNEIVCTG